MGRALKFKTPRILKNKIDAYFKDCADNGRPLTVTGLALALDTSRETLLQYEGLDDVKKDGITDADAKVYIDTIKKAKLICHNYAEEALYNGKNVAGVIFNLKNNYGWRDKTEQSIDIKGTISLTEAINEANATEDE